MTRPGDTRCVVCAAAEWVDLPEVGPQSMASDWRVLPVPLRKRACAACGLVSNAAAMPAGFFEDGYSLYGHSPFAVPGEGRRQRLYAQWIVKAYERGVGASPPPRSVLDVGCGNGSLLLALREYWPEATLLGCDPAGAAVEQAVAAGCNAWQGTTASLWAKRTSADLIVSVNVIEHADDPVGFLQDLTRGLAPDGMLILVCPDGARRDVELLIADHVHSFACGHLRGLLDRAGLRLGHRELAPDALGSFQMVTATRQPASSTSPVPATVSVVEAGRLHAYLQQWSTLDDRLVSRVGDTRVSCFGIGESASLLRAYAPRTWQRVRTCTADEIPDTTKFGAVPVVPLDQLAADTPLLLGVRPQDQPRLADRLSTRFARVITWHDLIEA